MFVFRRLSAQEELQTIVQLVLFILAVISKKPHTVVGLKKWAHGTQDVFTCVRSAYCGGGHTFQRETVRDTPLWNRYVLWHTGDSFLTLTSVCVFVFKIFLPFVMQGSPQKSNRKNRFHLQIRAVIGSVREKRKSCRTMCLLQLCALLWIPTSNVLRYCVSYLF